MLPAMEITVRPLTDADAAAGSALHQDVLDGEFIARCGSRFRRCYHRAWADSADSIALAAQDAQGEMIGVLLGALDPASHYRTMLRRHGLTLGFWLLARTVTHPRFALELLATRLLRYASGVLRVLVLRQPDQAGSAVGEVTHVMVRREAQGKGAGTALLQAAADLGRRAGLDELMLVTPLDNGGARRLYEHLGWEPTGVRVTRSGEKFLGYRLKLNA
jgi:GNAT superfamily N-acetyltransferase